MSPVNVKPLASLAGAFLMPEMGRKAGEMPKESFWSPTQIEGEQPELTITWGTTPTPGVYLNNREIDRSGLNRLITALRRARDSVHGADS